MLYISEKGMRPALKCTSFIEEDFSQKVCSFRTLFSGAVATDAERGLLRVYEVLCWVSRGLPRPQSRYRQPAPSNTQRPVEPMASAN